MEISSQSNSYQMMQQYQQPIQPSTEPLKPNDSYSFNKGIYEASQGNAINSKYGGIELTPQGQTNLNAKKEENAAEVDSQEQAKKDAQRGYATDYLAHKSMQSQVEIYLSVATNSNVELGNDSTASIIESLRDVQKQNNAVEAYATYQENQNPNNLTFS